MKTPSGQSDNVEDRLGAVVRQHWGYDSFRPLQREAMAAAVQGRDSLVVLPTGGGKSLCYQAPALLADKPTVVVSPLISLMKDQVDALLGRGIGAAFLNSSLEPADHRIVIDGIRDGAYKLIFVAPERFAGDAFLSVLEASGVSAFAIDEAHCISHWGHDFRSDYRRLGVLRQRFPNASIHAFTATATPRVRSDIIEQLGLADPAVLVGDFFRPNLMYRAMPRGRGFRDVMDAVRQRAGQPGIVYCIRRVDVDELTARLRSEGTKAIGYHAGMHDKERTEAQDAFAAGRINVVVATVAFGMGIDCADIRYVIHAAMPKSIEHYQQETGRAGRDGKPADCILFYSGADFGLWRTLIEDNEGANTDDQIRRLSEMYGLCTGATCRHRKLVTYFGQAWDRDNCGACDVCTEGLRPVADATVLAQKILSCIARTGQRYGAAYITEVLRGKRTDRVVRRGHEQLSTFGLTSEQSQAALMTWINQLADQDLLERVGDFNVLEITDKGWQVLRSEAEARLYEVGKARRSKTKPGRRSPRSADAPVQQTAPQCATPADAAAKPEHVDADAAVLFGKLRDLRRAIAAELRVPAYMVFADKSLREMARECPTNADALLSIHGVGPAKVEKFGRAFVDAIRSHVGTTGH